MEKLAMKLSPFELACWNWYSENVNSFARDHGIVAEMFKNEKLAGTIRKMFLTALDAIYYSMNFIQSEMLKQKKAEA